MGREWELSYRLGLLRHRICFAMASNASPEDSLELELPNPRESGELSRKGSKNFSLPESETFIKIIEKRQRQSDIYMTFIEKMIEKQTRYQEISVESVNQFKKFFQDTKTNKILYLEKHRIIPGHERGKYEKKNVILLTFAEHTMAHYLRYLQYGRTEDLRAYRIMVSNSDEEIRLETASFAGKIGGRRQQELLREQNLGWYNSDQQRERGLKGAAEARERGVGAYDPQNLADANKAWKERYKSDPVFRSEIQQNLFVGTMQRIGIVVSYYDKDKTKVISVRYSTPYTSVSQKGFEYTENRVHMSEDLFWYHLKFAEKPSQSYDCYDSNLNES
jgi:hypothetical protein